LSVVDGNTLRGSINHDGALNVIEKELAGDWDRFITIVSRQENPTYIKTPIWSPFPHHRTWLIINILLGLISSLMILLFYMPTLTDNGGDT